MGFKKMCCFVCVIVFGIVSYVCAEFSQMLPQGDGQEVHRGFPQEAIDACVGMSEGDTVSVMGPRGETMTATCHMIDGQLIAFPDRGPRHERFQEGETAQSLRR